MKLESFSKVAQFQDLTEIEKIERLAFFFDESKGEPLFKPKDFSELLVSLGYAKPNHSRLIEKIKGSNSFIKGTSKDTFRLSPKKRRELKDKYPDLSDSEEIISDDSLLPESLFTNTKRRYLVRMAQQINASYEGHLFDGTTLLMRRLLEILLIHAFQHAGIESEIESPDGNYVKLKTLINKASSSAVISLTPETRKSIDQFRELGNLSAHKVTYNCRRDDIKPIRMEYRAIIEELLYKGGLVYS